MSAIGAASTTGSSAVGSVVRSFAPALTPIQGYGRSANPLADAVRKEYELDPMGGESAAIDRVSASFTYDPSRGANQPSVPGASLGISPSNALVHMSTAQIDALSTSDFLAASQSNVAAIAHAGSPQSMLALADRALAPDPVTGRNSYDRKLDQLELRKTELIERSKQDPANAAMLLKLAADTAKDILLVQRDREKLEAIRKLLMSLLMGVVPKALIARMIELGLGGMVQAAIESVVGSGRAISKSMSQQLHELAAMGISLHIPPPEDTFEGLSQEERTRALQGLSTTAEAARRVGNDAPGASANGTNGSTTPAAAGASGSTGVGAARAGADLLR